MCKISNETILIRTEQWLAWPKCGLSSVLFRWQKAFDRFATVHVFGEQSGQT